MKLTKRHHERFKNRIHEYRGRAVGFRCDRVVIPGNQSATREFLVHPGAVGILAFESPEKILFVKQYRYPIGQFTLEIPAGKLSAGEKPSACVRRELEEETGFRARHIAKLVSYWPTAAFSTEVIHLYWAKDLQATRPNPDVDEFLEIVRMSPRQVEQALRTGVIKDSKTLIAYLSWKALFS